MKKSNYIIYMALLAVIFTTFSCEDDDKVNPIQSIQNAAIVTMLIENENINVNPDSLTFFSAEVDARPDVVEYALSVSRVAGGVRSDTISYETYTSFPFTLNITRADLAGAFSIGADEVEDGESYDFVGTSTDDDGVIFTIKNFTDGNGFIPGTSTLEFNSIGYEFTVDVVNE